ncbi:acyl-CoA dehydrogenase family protein [bacterium]|nr:acyl-CoA dehydrogenase family protein [bacterium]
MDKSTSFMRSLCLGEVVEEMIFPFPKMKAEESETLRAVFDSFDAWLKGREKEFREWDEKGHMPAEFVQQMREFGLFSFVIPETYGGMGLSSTAYSRTMQELAKHESSIAITAGAHSSIGMRGLLLFGTDAQKQRYMPDLATGKMIAAFCLTEPGSGSDAASIKTTATRQGDKWILNGDKLWITNGGIADFFTVFAKTDTKEGKMTAFIVTRDMPGVKTGPHEDKMGIRASSTTTVLMENVTVGDEHVLGEVGKGFKVAMAVLNSGRTGLGGGSVGGMKKAIELATKQAKQRVQFGQPISEFGLVKQKLGHMVVECFAAESTVSMVAGFVDQGYKDYAVEAAISKVFSTEALWRTLDEALQIAGGNGFMREFPYERMMRDCRINRIFEGTNDILRLFIALTAMNDVGHQLKELSSSLGNVFTDPIKGFGLLSEYARRRMANATGVGSDTITKANPELKAATAIFNEATRELATFADKLLRKHGKKIIDRQFATRRLADVMIDLFALACTISRVTALIEEKGSAACTEEKQILTVFSGQVRRRTSSNFGKIDENDDELIKSLADAAVEKEGYRWDTL